MIHNKRSSQQIYEVLRNEIINQHFVSEQRLVEEELAKRFQVSRTPIRQALQHLAIEGFVEMIPYRGSFVKKLSPDELKDLFQVRMVLERFAAELFCSVSNGEVIEKLKNNLKEAKEAIVRNDIKTYSNLDEEFHQLIMLGCNNKEACSIAEQLNQKTYIFRARSFTLPNQMEKSLREHEEIIRCIEGKEVVAAGKAAEKHVKGVLDAFYEYLMLEKVFNNSIEAEQGGNKPC